mmetsp:Transcript_520/g.1591  ORF Transcript_520/g.1591 Transcript_520/m.1591 type:complete len:464 (+) Transcript_520:42-1433(+)
MADRQPHLAAQDLSKLDVHTLHALSPEVISRQATINIGTIGHVAHGKSTVVKAISGVQTVRFKNELERNITIKLGYANAKIYQCKDPACPRPGNYQARGSSTEDRFKMGRFEYEVVRHVSFVDCPGHDILMATMLNGAAVMDAALLLIAGNEPCPQPQTSEHLAAVEIMKLKHIIILQNKIDLVKEANALSQHEDIKAFIKGTVADNAPIIPVSAQLKYNIDVIAEYIAKKIPVPVRDFTVTPTMIVIRSFDVNKPGEEVKDLKGGVAGGSILQGVLKVGDEIEIRPGIVSRLPDGTVKCVPLLSKINSLYAEHNDLQFAVPGGLIGVGTLLDPTLTRADRLVGQVLGAVGKLPEVHIELEVQYYLLRRLLGVKTAEGEKQGKVQKLAKGEMLMVNIGSTSTGGRISAVKAELAKVQLTSPVCTSVGEKIALSRRIDKHWRLIGWGEIRRGVVIDTQPATGAS